MTGAIVATGPLAALAVDKAATLQRLTAFNAQLEQEAQMQRDAARWNHFLAGVPDKAWFVQQIDAEIAHAARNKQ